MTDKELLLHREFELLRACAGIRKRGTSAKAVKRVRERGHKLADAIRINQTGGQPRPMNVDLKSLENLLLRDPQNDRRLEIVSTLSTYPDGTSAFTVQEKGNPNGNRWRHTIKTEELGPK